MFAIKAFNFLNDQIQSVTSPYEKGLMSEKIASALGAIEDMYKQATRQTNLEENWHDPDLLKGLNKLCEKAVRNYCVISDGTKLCMKDYLSPDWKPQVKVEYGHTFICPVNFAEEHSNLIYQPSDLGDLTYEGFMHNFESPTTTIPSKLDNLVSKFPILFGKHFEKWTGGDDRLIKFKSHVTPYYPNKV